MKDLQNIINKKSEEESNLKADQAASAFIKAMKSESCSEYVKIKTIHVDSDGFCSINLIDLIRAISEQQKPKLAERLCEERSSEFYEKVLNMSQELNSYIQDFKE